MKIAILFLHGGGHSDHARYTKLEEKINAKGIITHAFDHHASSLAGRLREAEQELAKLKTQSNLTDSDIFLWGSSMGGHVVCRLINSHPQVKGLILQSAAAYSKASENLTFGPAFTTEITKENNWISSPAFLSLSQYSGRVLVMYGEHDQIIPDGVKKIYIERAISNGEYHVLAGAGHSLLRPHAPTEHTAWEQMYNYALQFINCYN